MCFSAEASFAGGVIISAIGLITLKKVHNPSQLIFGSIPLFFGIQQFCEGFLWISFQNPDFVHYQKTITYLFLIMADVMWPFIIPLAVLLMEKNVKRKRILRIFLGIGIVLSLYYSFCLITFHVTPKIMGYHIKYVTDFPKTLALVAFGIYLMVTITPLFVSSVKRTHYLGVFMFLSCLVTAVFFTQYLTSVWCFFAALISGVIYWILSDSKKAFLGKV